MEGPWHHLAETRGPAAAPSGKLITRLESQASEVTGAQARGPRLGAAVGDGGEGQRAEWLGEMAHVRARGREGSRGQQTGGGAVQRE